MRISIGLELDNEGRALAWALDFPGCFAYGPQGPEAVIERFTVATRTGNIKAMIEVGVDVAVDTSAVAARMAEWPEVDFVWQVSGSEDVVLIVDAADTGGINGLITQAREMDEVVSTKTRLILDEQRG